MKLTVNNEPSIFHLARFQERINSMKYSTFLGICLSKKQKKLLVFSMEKEGKYEPPIHYLIRSQDGITIEDSCLILY